MPQMMPINWMISLFFFISIFIIFNMMNFYIFNFNIKMDSKTNNFSFKNLPWKW